MPTNFMPTEPFLPCVLYQSKPRARITVASENVSTLLMTVG